MEYLQGVGPHYIDHPDFINLNKAILDTFEPKHKYAFFTVCSWGKPYSASYIHRGIRHALRKGGVLDKLDYIHISSAGVVPADAELWAVNYDWNNEWIQGEMTFKLLQKRIVERLSAFVEKFQYEKKFVYLRPNSNTLKAVQLVGELDKDFIYVFPANPNRPLTLSKRAQRELSEIRADGLHDDPDDVLIVPSIAKRTVAKIRKELGLDE